MKIAAEGAPDSFRKILIVDRARDVRLAKHPAFAIAYP